MRCTLWPTLTVFYFTTACLLFGNFVIIENFTYAVLVVAEWAQWGSCCCRGGASAVALSFESRHNLEPGKGRHRFHTRFYRHCWCRPAMSVSNWISSHVANSATNKQENTADLNEFCSGSWMLNWNGFFLLENYCDKLRENSKILFFEN